MARIVNIPCCAIGFLRAGNEDPLWHLDRIVNRLEGERWNWMFKRGAGGWTTIMCVTILPSEQPLADNLAALGFKVIHTFKRRHGYPEGYLKLWARDVIGDESTKQEWLPPLEEVEHRLRRRGEFVNTPRMRIRNIEPVGRGVRP